MHGQPRVFLVGIFISTWVLLTAAAKPFAATPITTAANAIAIAAAIAIAITATSSSVAIATAAVAAAPTAAASILAAAFAARSLAAAAFSTTASSAATLAATAAATSALAATAAAAVPANGAQHHEVRGIASVQNRCVVYRCALLMAGLPLSCACRRR